jgi:trimethylamine:corrinoid methyltransferase-like protein
MTNPENWLESSIADAGPGGNYLNQKSTRNAVLNGIWYLSEFGFHDTYEKWKAANMPDVIDVIQENVKKILKNHQPLALDAQADRELKRLERKVRELENEPISSARQK